MRQRPLQAVLLVYAIEQSDLGGDALSHEDRAQASREAADERAVPAAGDPSAQITGSSERFLARRADALLARLRVRSPGIDRVLAAAAGPTGFDRSILLLGFLLGFAIAFADGHRIDIFAYPLIVLVLWNLIVYLILIARAFHLRQPNEAAGTVAAREAAALQRDGFFRRWLARTYANRVYARIDALITHSIGFNAPLAPGLRRFAADWRELGRPLFRERARRLLHLSAILAAAGLMAGYFVRGVLLRQNAGWGNTIFGPASAHTALVTLYGAASAIKRIPIPSAQDLQTLAWTGATGGGQAGPWLRLIYWTALLYIVLPRLLGLVLTTLSLWRRSATLRTPATFPGYLAAVLRSLPPAPESKPAESSG